MSNRKSEYKKRDSRFGGGREPSLTNAGTENPVESAEVRWPRDQERRHVGAVSRIGTEVRFGRREEEGEARRAAGREDASRVVLRRSANGDGEDGDDGDTVSW